MAAFGAFLAANSGAIAAGSALAGTAITAKASRDASKASKAATAAASKPPPVMPDQEELRRQQARAFASRVQGSGRASTVLSDGDRLGP